MNSTKFRNSSLKAKSIQSIEMRYIRVVFWYLQETIGIYLVIVLISSKWRWILPMSFRDSTLWQKMKLNIFSYAFVISHKQVSSKDKHTIIFRISFIKSMLKITIKIRKRLIKMASSLSVQPISMILLWKTVFLLIKCI